MIRRLLHAGMNIQPAIHKPVTGADAKRRTAQFSVGGKHTIYYNEGVMRIIKFSYRNIDAWLDYFDNRAFSDHKAWKGCYCTYFYYPKFEDSKNVCRTKREYAKWLIENDKMTGYLVYEKGKVIGWCNTGPKLNYSKLSQTNQLHKGIKSIVCFLIEERYRGQGIAKAILKRIIKDSKKDGTKKLEAYPNNRAKNQFGHYHGPIGMYLKNGFEIDERKKTTTVKLTIKGG